MPQAGTTRTVQSTHTEFGVCLKSLVLRKEKEKKIPADTFFFCCKEVNTRRYVGGQNVNQTTKYFNP